MNKVRFLGCLACLCSISLFANVSNADERGFISAPVVSSHASHHPAGCNCGAHQHGHVAATPGFSAHHGAGCGCGGSAEALWADFCNSGCQNSCDTGCGGTRFRLFRGLNLTRTSFNCDPMGWNLVQGCRDSFCGACRRPRLFGRCGCNSGFRTGLNCGQCNRPRIFGRCGCNGGFAGSWNNCLSSLPSVSCQPCFDGSFVRDCNIGFRRLSCDCRGWFSRRNLCRPRLFGCGRGFSCGNFRLFNNPRRDCGYSGCSADTCGCLGESIVHGTQYMDGFQGDHHFHESPIGQPQPINGLEIPADPAPALEIPQEIQPGLPLNPSPNGGALPSPGVPNSPETAIRGPFGRPVSFAVPVVEFPNLKNLFN